MIIYVTHDHIKRGVVRLSKCPVALAIKEHTHKAVTVDGRRIYIDSKEYTMPSVVRLFVSAFDRRRKVHPFAFTTFPK